LSAYLTIKATRDNFCNLINRNIYLGEFNVRVAVRRYLIGVTNNYLSFRCGTSSPRPKVPLELIVKYAKVIKR